MSPSATRIRSSEVRSWWHEYAAARDLTAAQLAEARDAHVVLQALADSVLDWLPLPGAGATWQRFEGLAAIGEIDLNLGRLAEAHADARAILTELAATYRIPAHSIWGVWAAEPPDAKLMARVDEVGHWTLDGRKAWCGGAGGSTHALVTANAPDGRRLFTVDLRQSAVVIDEGTWSTPALHGADTRSVEFTAAPASPIGGVDDYLTRPGFWHGAVGVAAVWYGGAVGVGQRLLDAARRRDLADVDLAHLGAVDAALTGARATLIAAAGAFDADPTDRANDAAVIARGVRAVVESAAETVLHHVGHALGPAPLVGDDEHWRRVGDLQLYLRQSHGERDLVDLGRRLIAAVPVWSDPRW